MVMVSLLARGATRRTRLSHPQRLPTLDPNSTAATVRLLHIPSLLSGLTPASPGALRSTLSLGGLRSTRQQVRIPVFREAMTAPQPHCGCMRWDVTYTHTCFALGEGLHIHARSGCVHSRDDTDRLTYASRFVRVIYSSLIVSVKLGTVTPLRRCGLAVHER